MKKEKLKNIAIDVASGAAMGVAAAIPGVSGGTVAVMTHVYDRHLGHMNNLKSRKFFSNLVCLLPLLVGIIVGIIPAAFLFNEAFQGFVFGIISLFAGLILGGMPGLFDEIKHTKVKPIYIVIGVIATLIALSFGVLSVQLGGKLDIASYFNMDAEGNFIANGHVAWWLYLVLIPIGLIAAVALIVPGISGSMILLVLGFYSPILSTVDWWKALLTGNGSWSMFGQLMGIYLCLLVGIILGFFTIVKLMKYLLDKFRVASFYGIIGFVSGSFISLYYNNDIYQYYLNWINHDSSNTWLSMGWEIGVGAILLILGTLASYLLVRYSRKHTSTPLDTDIQDKQE